MYFRSELKLPPTILQPPLSSLVTLGKGARCDIWSRSYRAEANRLMYPLRTSYYALPLSQSLAPCAQTEQPPNGTELRKPVG